MCNETGIDGQTACEVVTADTCQQSLPCHWQTCSWPSPTAACLSAKPALCCPVSCISIVQAQDDGLVGLESANIQRKKSTRALLRPWQRAAACASNVAVTIKELKIIVLQAAAKVVAQFQLDVHASIIEVQWGLHWLLAARLALSHCFTLHCNADMYPTNCCLHFFERTDSSQCLCTCHHLWSTSSQLNDNYRTISVCGLISLPEVSSDNPSLRCETLSQTLSTIRNVVAVDRYCVVTMNDTSSKTEQQRCCFGLLYYSQALQAEGRKPVRQ